MRSLLVLFLLACPLAAETAAPEGELDDAVRSLHVRDLPAAEELLLALRDERPKDAEVAFYLGRTHLAQGRSKEAVSELERATRLDPSSSTYQFWLAEALVERIDEVPFFFKLGVARRMRAAYEKAVELDPENLRARVAVARFHAEAPAVAGGSSGEAQAQLAEIERRDPALARVTRALIHERLGRLELAEAELEAATVLDPQSVLGWRETGFFYQRRERWEDAARAFEEALACDPGDGVALYESARSAIAISEQQLARAEAALAAYLRRDPGPEPLLLSDVETPRPAMALEKLGQVYERLGRPELAAGEYRAAAALGASNEDLREALARTRSRPDCPPAAAARME